jgi:hypothetical protein
MESLLEGALSKYQTSKAQALLIKIAQKKHKLCYAYTCKTFTAGQVSDQRMEQGMASINSLTAMVPYMAPLFFELRTSYINVPTKP